MTLQGLFAYIFKIWRPRRIKKLIHLLSPAKTDVILDVGGYPWFGRLFHVLWNGLTPLILMNSRGIRHRLSATTFVFWLATDAS
jgi:hypothetical protein